MKTSPVFAQLMRLLAIIVELMRLPVADLHFDCGDNYAGDAETFRHFTKPHPRYKLFPNKALGAALIDLRQFATHGDYLQSVKGKGNAGAQSRKARTRGYSLRTIDRNHFTSEIFDINMSSAFRQGRPMDPAYRERITRFEQKPGYLYFGMFDKEGRLVAYCNVALFGNFAGTEQVLGYKNRDGVMYLLFTEIIRYLMETRQCDYFMYDTVFGAQDGLRDFKRRLGFRPFRARYTLRNPAVFQ